MIISGPSAFVIGTRKLSPLLCMLPRKRSFKPSKLTSCMESKSLGNIEVLVPIGLTWLDHRSFKPLVVTCDRNPVRVARYCSIPTCAIHLTILGAFDPYPGDSRRREPLYSANGRNVGHEYTVLETSIHSR